MGGKDEARRTARAELRPLFDMGAPGPLRKFLGIDVRTGRDGAKRLLTFFAGSIRSIDIGRVQRRTAHVFRQEAAAGVDSALGQLP